MADSQSAFLQASGSFPAFLEQEFCQLTDYYTGSYCCLVKARRHGQWWMLKCLKPEYRRLPFYENLLQKEYLILSRINHPNVVKAVSLEEVQPYGRCIVMEYLEGVTLDKVQTDRKIRLKLAEQLLEAVAYFHSLQIVHRDLKPQNILVTNNGKNLKVVDFGLSDSDSYAVLKQPAGTEAYMAPEQREATVPDMRNDVYSLGVILNELQLGWLYRWVIHRCVGKEKNRCPEAGELLKAFRKATTRPLRWLMAFTFFVLMGNLLWTGLLSTSAPAEIERLDSMMVEKENRAQKDEADFQAAFREGCLQIDQFMQTNKFQEMLSCPVENIGLYDVGGVLTKAVALVQDIVNQHRARLAGSELDDLDYKLGQYVKETYSDILLDRIKNYKEKMYEAE